MFLNWEYTYVNPDRLFLPMQLSRKEIELAQETLNLYAILPLSI